MNNKKIVIITIIVLLCVFAPLTILGFIFKDGSNLLDENPKHETFYENKIWFYDDNDKLLSKYECNTQACNFSKSTVTDDTYGINYLKNGEHEQVGIIDDRYTFITDGAKIYLYNIINGQVMGSYNSLKNYSTNIKNNTFILQREDGLWGAIRVGQNLKSSLGFEYDFIGLKNIIDEDKFLDDAKFIVSKDNKWYLVDNTNKVLTGYFENPIVDYSDNYVFTKDNDVYKVYNYEANGYLNNYVIKNYVIEDNYIGIVTENFLLIYKDLNEMFLKSINLTEEQTSIKLKKENEKLNVLVNGEILETIELS